MARISIDGIGIDYEIIGPANAPLAVLTPGGRYARDYPGVPQLGQKITDGGYRVLLWDRPNCGASDVCFQGSSESALHASMLVALLDALGASSVALVAGSAGARVSLLAASQCPERVSGMFLWWISGGPIAMAQLAAYYCGDAAIAAARGGMEAVAALPGFAQQIERNPENRNRILAWEADAFIQRMQEWAAAYAWVRGVPVPGLSADDYGRLTMPTTVLRSGQSDISHRRETSEQLAKLLPNAKLLEPPWPDQEWNNVSLIPNAQGRGRFERWPLLAPMILDFLNQI